MEFKYSGMNSTDRQTYEAPSVEVIKVAQGGMICASDPKYNTPFEEGEDW